MDILEKLHKIEGGIYDISYCNAGVGFKFYEPPVGQCQSSDLPANWREYLFVHNYYPTFEAAVEAEYKRLCVEGLIDAKT